jgi:hypothetical protein
VLHEPTDSEPTQELTTTTDNNPTQTQTQTQTLAQAQDLISRNNTTTQTPTQTPTQIKTQDQSQPISPTQPLNQANEQEFVADIENRLRTIQKEVDLHHAALHVGKFGFFDNDEWDKIIVHWKGIYLKRIPTDCIETFRDITNEAAEESLTSNKSAIRALKMIPRLLLWKINGNRRSVTKTLNSRMDLWKTRKFAQLWNELQTHETKQDQRISPSPRNQDDARITAAYERVELAELSKAKTFLLSPGLYTGTPGSIQDLFATD